MWPSVTRNECWERGSLRPTATQPRAAWAGGALTEGEGGGHEPRHPGGVMPKQAGGRSVEHEVGGWQWQSQGKESLGGRDPCLSTGE